MIVNIFNCIALCHDYNHTYNTKNKCHNMHIIKMVHYRVTFGIIAVYYES